MSRTLFMIREHQLVEALCLTTSCTQHHMVVMKLTGSTPLIISELLPTDKRTLIRQVWNRESAVTILSPMPLVLNRDLDAANAPSLATLHLPRSRPPLGGKTIGCHATLQHSSTPGAWP